MKKKLLLALTTVMVMTSSLTTYAGQWKQNGDIYRYQNDDGSYVTNSWYQDMDGKWYHFDANGMMQTSCWIGNYYLSASGEMLTDSFTPDDYYVGLDGAKKETQKKEYENVVELDYNGLLQSWSGKYKIYYNAEIISNNNSKCKISNIGFNKDRVLCAEVEIMEKGGVKSGNGNALLLIKTNSGDYIERMMSLPKGEVGTKESVYVFGDSHSMYPGNVEVYID